jgi:hypothetical protein
VTQEVTQEVTWTLHGFGPVGWARVRELCAGLTCAWADYAGFHEGECPDQPPPYTHLWGWSAGRLARVRIDGEQGVVGLLTPAPAPIPGSVLHEPVEVVVTEVMNMGEPARTHLVRVVGPMPLTFVAGPAFPATGPAAGSGP